MGINSKFDGDFKAIKLAGMADDMLAEVVADHASDTFRPSNRANAMVAGTYVPYTVAIDGRLVHRGRGEIFPRQQVAAVINPPGTSVARTVRKLPTILMDWRWEDLELGAVAHALAVLVRANKTIEKFESPTKFLSPNARLALLFAEGEVGAITRILLLRFGKNRYPKLFQRLDEARALYRVYRIVSFASGLLGSGSDSDADPTVLAWIAEQLRAGSPVLSGAYRDAHMLYADGEELMRASEVNENTQLPQAQEFSIANTVPYARKIEMGTTKAGRAFVISVPNHLYERVAKDASERFEGLAEISFEMRAVIGAQQTPQRSARPAHNKSDVRYPSIIVRF